VPRLTDPGVRHRSRIAAPPCHSAARELFYKGMDEHVPAKPPALDGQDRPDPSDPAAVDAVIASMRVFLGVSLTRTGLACDVATADALGLELLTALDSSADWDASIIHVGETLARAFGERPADWGRIGEKLELHFRAIFVADHPRAQRSIQQRKPDGQTLSPVRLELVGPFVRRVMLSGSREQRLEFYSVITSHAVWDAAAASLADAEATPDEIIQFLSVLGRPQFGFLGDAAAGLVAWTHRDPKRAVGLVNQLTSAELHERGAGALQVLVETLGEDPAREAWLNEVFERLFASRKRMAWNLVVALECFAAPPSTSVGQRHARMLARVLRAPGTLVPPAMHALRRDARTAPTESLSTLQQLLDLADLAASNDREPNDVLSVAADVASSALNGLRARGDDPSPVAAFLAALLPLGPGRTRHGLDFVLDGLLADRSEQVKSFFSEWLGMHSRAIAGGHSTLEELLPVLAHKLGPERETQWLCDVLVAGSPPARVAAATLLGSRKAGVPEAAFRDVSETDARILMHEMIDCGRMGVPLLGALVRLASLWPSLIPEIGPILTEELAPNYPEACKALLPSLTAHAGGSPPDVAAAWQSVASGIDTAVNELTEAHSIRLSIPEVVRIAPAAGVWRLAQQREMDKAYRVAQQRSVFASLVSVVPIGRGDQSLMAGFPNAAPTGFQDHSFTMVIPAGEVIDPLGEQLRRVTHLERAEQLRKERSSTP